MLLAVDYKSIIINRYTLDYFGGEPTIVVCDNCKQAVTANKDWIDPDLNKDYAAWFIDSSLAPFCY